MGLLFAFLEGAWKFHLATSKAFFQKAREAVLITESNIATKAFSEAPVAGSFLVGADL